MWMEEDNIKIQEIPKVSFKKRLFAFSNFFFSALVGLIFAGIFCTAVYVMAYQSYGTLNPSCSPGEAGCTVAPPETTEDKDQPNGYIGLDADGNLSGIFIPRTDTLVNLQQIVLEDGEIGIASDTHAIYVGDGTTPGGVGVLASIADADISDETAGYKVDGTRVLTLFSPAGINPSESGNLLLGNSGNFTMSAGAINNIYIGDLVGQNGTTGNSNVSIGVRAGESLTTGSSDVFVGYQSGAGNDVGNNNTYVGTMSGATSSGDNNVFLGFLAGYGSTSSDTFILDSKNVDGLDIMGDDYEAFLSWAATEETTALMYGTFATAPASQQLTINAADIYMPYLSVGVAGTIKTNSSGKLYVDASSARFKEKIEPLVNDFTKILQVKPKTFLYKPTGEQEIGYIAEDFDNLGLKDLVNYDKQNNPSSINYDRIPLYVLEIAKQQQQDIDLLKALVGLPLNENGTVGNESVSSVASGSLLSAASGLLSEIGIKIQNGITTIENLVTKSLTSDTAKITNAEIETVGVKKLQMIDEDNGDTYCITIKSGEFVKTKGQCGTSLSVENIPSISELETSQAVLKAQLAAADAKKSAEQAEQAAENAAENATQQIQEVAESKIDLQTALALAQLKIQTYYTAESWQNFTNALDAAVTIDNNSSATKIELDAATSNLNNAMGNLIQTSQDSNNEVVPENNSSLQNSFIKSFSNLFNFFRNSVSALSASVFGNGR